MLRWHHCNKKKKKQQLSLWPFWMCVTLDLNMETNQMLDLNAQQKTWRREEKSTLGSQVSSAVLCKTYYIYTYYILEMLQLWNFHEIILRQKNMFSPLVFNHSKRHADGCSKILAGLLPPLQSLSSNSFCRGFFSSLDTPVFRLSDVLKCNICHSFRKPLFLRGLNIQLHFSAV